MRRLTLRLAAVAAVALAVLPSASSASPGSPASSASSARAQTPPPDDKLAAVQRVLDARAAAVRAKDKQAFLATVDPDAAPSFTTAQSSLFDGLSSVPLSDYRLEARVFESGDLSAATRGKYGVPTFLPETRQRMRIKDYETADAVDSLWLTFVQRGDSWFVTADDDLSLLGMETARGLWDFGPVVAHATAHFLVLSHPAEAPRAQALGSIAEEAITRHNERWTLPWSGRIPVILPSTNAELGAIIQSTLDLDKFVAFVSYGATRDAGFETTAARVYIQDRNLGKYTRPFQVTTLVHELNHAAAAPVTGPFIPAWVHEGVADWIATGQRTNERHPNGSGPRLPRDFEFVTGSQAGIVRSYASSRSAISVLAREKGVAAPTAFLKALGDVRVAPGTVDYQVDLALRRAASVSLADLEALWSR